MPIGKNSIKRVKNNGYSAVKTEAPDMENSVIVKEAEVAVPAPVEKPDAPVAKRGPGRPRGSKAKKTTEKKRKAVAKASTGKRAKSSVKADTDKKVRAEAKSTVTKGRGGRPKKSAASVTQQERQNESYVNLGGNLPYYLL